MSRRLPPLNALRAFEAAARHNSFSGAASELRVNHAAISRHVRTLEARLGVILFRKAKRGVELTTAGARYRDVLSTAFDAIADATDTLTHPRRTQIRVSVHPAFAARWLVRRLAGFRKAYPTYDVVLDATPHLVDLQHGAADLAIRNGAPQWPGLERDLLARSRLFAMGARRLLRNRRRKLEPAELKAQVLLHDEDDGGLWRRWFAAAGIAEVDVSGGPRLLESGLAIDAAIAGQGIALADEFLVAEDLAAGRLVRLCDRSLEAEDCNYYLVSMTGTRQRKPIAAFRDWLLKESRRLRPS